MNSYTIKLLVFFLSLFILITISSQIYLAFKDTTKTEAAISYSAVEKIDFKGVFIRNETVIDYNGPGIINYPNPDGSKIAKGSIVANVYNNENEILTNQKIEKLTNELDLLNKAQNKGTTQVAQPEFLSNLIEQKYQEITSSIEKNDLENLSTQRSELLTLMNIMQIVIKKESNYDERISYLTDQISSLNAQKIAPLQSITVENPGYFVSYTDGYEDKLFCDNIDSITVDQIKSIVNQNNATSGVASSIGKIIDGYEWKMIGIIDNSRNYFVQGMQAQLNLSSNSIPVSVTIDNIKETNNSKESIVILSCDKLTYSLVQHRVERVEMLLNNYEGIKVPREAIRFNKSEKGVYIKLGQQIIFRKIDVIFEGSDYVLSRNVSKDGYLLLYDDIVIDGISVNSEISNTSATDKNSSESDPPTTSSNSNPTNIVVGKTTTEVTTTTSTAANETTKKGDRKND